MPQQGAQEKTEKPTPRRRIKAREQGQVAKSQEINSVAVLLAGMGALYLMGGYMYDQIMAFMRQVIGNLGTSPFNQAQFQDFSLHTLVVILKVVGPLWGVVFLAAVLVNLAQVGFLFAPKRLKPDFKKIDPIQGFKKFFSMRILVELVKNIGKLVVVGTVAYWTVRQEMTTLPKLASMEMVEILLYITSVCFKIFYRCILAMLVLAVADWAYQKFDFEKNLKMSKQEIKEEHKQTEGDPHVRARIRSIQRDQARRRMMAEVPKADVVITNPTHVAVALTYNMGDMDAPQVVAKGAGNIAARIKEIARENNVPVIEDKPLAQALFKMVEVGQAIPGDLYEAVATILAHVYRMKNKTKQFLQNQRDKT